MKAAFEKYIPFVPINLKDRQWPDKAIDRAPIWCSVDLRDGNQALVEPMNLQEKVTFFKLLVDMGFKEIEVGFPSASETEYEILRTLIDQNLIPDDVTIQVLVQAREHLIEKTFEAIRGAKNVIVHFYNSTSALQRKVVFKKDMDGIIDIAVKGARLIRQLAAKADKGTSIRFEYSPESFSGTEVENSVKICAKVMEAIGATKDNKIIINLPSTVQVSSSNHFADQVEYVCRNLPNREAAIISIHPHNDRGTGIADAEFALMAGADRIEGTIFGNGERTGNVDIITLGLNMYTQGVDPRLDFSDINHIKEVYEACTKMKVHERQPYGGELVFTAFSGSHQDAINKGFEYMKDSGTEYWEVPYLPIDPSDIGRQYDPVIRINSQSGKGGAAFIMQQNFGYNLPKAMHPEFGNIVKAEADRTGKELSAQDIMDLFNDEYLKITGPFSLRRHKIEEGGQNGNSFVHFEGSIRKSDEELNIEGEGNGPIDAFFNALNKVGIEGYEFISYHEHAISTGSNAKAVAYIELKRPDGGHVFGVGIESNINIASIKGVLCAINRSLK
ncbi:2-isopropylmalate synthase [Oxobacter pfennigii]|uniref:2-isopropylmalate synthase n=1 Tax=Oxobacter pfennigii TaxID=36849 RepID=A0A0P8WXQ9_9CLOT|nr:2-isopropylmalate synthase [Oxobacter pfennigii]KPU43131.1 2-isopropylmalate synthase [Oxobacter pfennigii]